MENPKVNSHKKVISIFFPLRNEIANLPKLESVIEYLEDFLITENLTGDFFIHDNDSTDGSWDFIESMGNRRKIRAFRLNRDIGYQESLALAFDNALGDAFIVIQSDLQDPPEIVVEMIKQWKLGMKSIVGIPINRKEKMVEKIGRNMFLFLFRSAGDLKGFQWFTDFYLLDYAIYKNYRNLPLVNQFIRGRLINDFTFEKEIKYQRIQRVAGQSNFSFSKKYHLALSAVLLHSSRMVRKLVLFSFILGLLSILASAILFALAIFGILSSTKIGFYGTFLILFFNITFTFILFGISLEYLSRIHVRLHSSEHLLNQRNLLYKKII
jgi:dolichol-phosphate mannosyltransferase